MKVSKRTRSNRNEGLSIMYNGERNSGRQRLVDHSEKYVDLRVIEDLIHSHGVVGNRLSRLQHLYRPLHRKQGGMK